VAFSGVAHKAGFFHLGRANKLKRKGKNQGKQGTFENLSFWAGFDFPA